MPAARPPFRAQVRWKLTTPGHVVIGPRARTALQVEALRDCQVRVVTVLYPGIPAGATAEALLVAQPRGEGRATVLPEGDTLAVGREDLDQVWPAGEDEVLEYNRCEAPHDFWGLSCVLDVPRGLCVGVVLRCGTPAAAKVIVGGT